MCQVCTFAHAQSPRRSHGKGRDDGRSDVDPILKVHLQSVHRFAPRQASWVSKSRRRSTLSTTIQRQAARVVSAIAFMRDDEGAFRLNIVLPWSESSG